MSLIFRVPPLVPSEIQGSEPVPSEAPKMTREPKAVNPNG